MFPIIISLEIQLLKIWANLRAIEQDIGDSPKTWCLSSGSNHNSAINLPWNLRWVIQFLCAHFFSLNQRFTKLTTFTDCGEKQQKNMLWNVIVQVSFSLRKLSICLENLGYSLFTDKWSPVACSTQEMVALMSIICVSIVRWFPGLHQVVLTFTQEYL